LVRHAPHQETVGRPLLRQHRQRGLVEVGDQLGHLFLLGVLRITRLHRGNGEAFPVRIGIGKRALQALAAEHDHETVLLAGLDDDLGVAELLHFGGEQRAELLAGGGWIRPARRSVTVPLASSVQKLARGSDVSRLERQAQAERLDHSTADLELQRVITEESEMPRSAPGRGCPGRWGSCAPERSPGRPGRRGSVCGRLPGGSSRPGVRRDVAQAVEHHQGKLGFVFRVSSEYRASRFIDRFEFSALLPAESSLQNERAHCWGNAAEASTALWADRFSTTQAADPTLGPAMARVVLEELGKDFVVPRVRSSPPCARSTSRSRTASSW